MPAVYAPQLVPSGHRGDYPHMSKRDVQVWNAFLTLHGDQFVWFAYDVALGGVTIEAQDVGPAERLGWQYNTALKIDACGLRDKEVWIIEVKPEATVSALGGAIAYTMVAEREQVFDNPLKPVIVCNYCQPDVKWCAQELRVAVFEVPA
jgi:hypothetical protein